MSGHAGYAPRGGDIVCSAASVLVLTAARLLTESADISAADSEITVAPGHAVLSAPVSPDTDGIFAFLLRGTALIRSSYPRHIYSVTVVDRDPVPAG